MSNYGCIDHLGSFVGLRFEVLCVVILNPEKNVVGIGDPVAMTKDEAGPWALDQVTPLEKKKAIFRYF